MIISRTSLVTKEMQMKTSMKYFIPDKQNWKCASIAKITENMEEQDQLLVVGVSTFESLYITIWQ